MPRYSVIERDGHRYVSFRYNNFEALGAAVAPQAPWPLVPLHNDITDAVEDARARSATFAGELRRLGVDKVVRMMHPTVRDERSIEYLAKLSLPLTFFRGERSLAFNIMPTRYRLAGAPDPSRVIEERVRFEMQCAERMRTYLKDHGVPDVTTDQARAAARHYGAPSSFVDFTFNPDVAASFGHPAFTEREREEGAPLGVLYSLSLTDMQGLFGLAAWHPVGEGGRDIIWINLATEWRIPYSSFDPARGLIEEAMLIVKVPPDLVTKPLTVRTRYVPSVPRITAQEGIFVDALFEAPGDWRAQVLLWTVLDFACQKRCFLRQDFQYENAESGITLSSLFPPDAHEIAEATHGFARWSP